MDVCGRMPDRTMMNVERNDNGCRTKLGRTSDGMVTDVGRNNDEHWMEQQWTSNGTKRNRNGTKWTSTTTNCTGDDAAE